MPFSIETFKANLQYGVARPHSYLIILNNPAGPGGDVVSMMCESAELPGRGFSTTQRVMFGPPRKIPYQDIFTDLTLTFICSADMYEKRFFDAWQKKVSDSRDHYMNYHDSFAQNIIVQKLSDPGDGVRIDYACVAIDAWPLTMNPIPLSYKDVNSYSILPVTFAYYQWLTQEDMDSDSGGSGVIERPGVTPEPTPGLPEAPQLPEIP